MMMMTIMMMMRRMMMRMMMMMTTTTTTTTTMTMVMMMMMMTLLLSSSRPRHLVVVIIVWSSSSILGVRKRTAFRLRFPGTKCGPFSGPHNSPNIFRLPGVTLQMANFLPKKRDQFKNHESKNRYFNG